MISGVTAVSACISPSTISSGARFFTSCTALRTLSANGLRGVPKVENRSSAPRGFRGGKRDLRKILRGGFYVHSRVGKKVDAALGNHQIDSTNPAEPVAHR